MTVPDKFFILVDEILSGNCSLENYEQICIILASLDASDIRTILSKCDMLKVLLSLNLSDRQSSAIALRLASVIFSFVSLLEFAHSHQEELLIILRSKKFELIEFILRKLQYGVHNSSKPAEFFPDPILEAVVQLVSHEKLSVFNAAKELLITIASEMPDGLDKLLNDSVSTVFQSSCKKADHLLRFTEFAIELAFLVPNSFTRIENAGLLTPILDGLRAKDPLVCLNWLELAKRLVAFAEGYKFLDKHNILNNLMNELSQLSDDALSNLLIPGYVGFFSVLAKCYPSPWLVAKTDFVTVLRNVSQNNDFYKCMIALESIGDIATSSDSRKHLNEHFSSNNLLSSVLPKLGELLSNAPTEIYIRTTNCLANLFRRISYAEEILIEDALMTRDWACSISRIEPLNKCAILPLCDKDSSVNAVLKRLHSLATQPFVDLRVAALNAIDAISTQPWGIRAFARQPGFFEYLVNRQTEQGLSDKSTLMQFKMNIVNNVIHTAHIFTYCAHEEFRNLLTPDQLNRLNLYSKEGKWGSVQAEAAVALEPG